MGPNRLDLTSDFIDLGFEGFVEIRQDADAVIYSLPEFKIRFIRLPDEDLVVRIKLDFVSLLVAQKVSSTSTRHWFPISLSLDLENTGHTLADVSFRVPKDLVIASEYLKFGVNGEVTQDVSGKLLIQGLPPRMVARAVWPISAEGNRWIENPGARRPEVRYKVPADPSDPCATERIH